MARTRVDHDVDVVIAGGGPVGMALAIELDTRGISARVIEQRGEHETFKARSNVTNARSMTHFRRWGIADELRKNDPVPTTFARDVVFVTRLNGHTLINIEGAVEWSEPFSIAPEVPEWAPNQAIEKTLHDRVDASAHVEMEWSSQVTEYVQDCAGVQATYVGPGGERRVTGRYLVIADGARSPLRKKMNVSLNGETLAHNTAWHIYAPELVQHFKTPVASLIWFVNEDVFADALVPQSAQGHWLYVMSPLPDDVDADDWETIRAMLYRSVGAEFAVEPVEGGAWVSHSRMAPTYSYGRVFLAGDAAHLTSPMGGFGMNMGISDAVDLGWKLAGTIQGWAGPLLLDTYTIERREASRFIIDGSAYNQSILAPQIVQPYMEEDSERGESARATATQLIVTEKTKEFRSLGAQLGYRYETSPVIVRDGTDAPPLDYGEYIPMARPGHLAPHLWLEDGVSLYDKFGPGFTLVRLDDIDTAPLDAAAARLGVPLKVVDLPFDEARELYETSLALIRPDQHVAWRGNELPADCVWLLDAVRGALSFATADRPGRAPAGERADLRAHLSVERLVPE